MHPVWQAEIDRIARKSVFILDQCEESPRGHELTKEPTYESRQRLYTSAINRVVRGWISARGQRAATFHVLVIVRLETDAHSFVRYLLCVHRQGFRG